LLADDEQMPPFLEILLIVEDPGHRAALADRIRRFGCEISCAPDLEQATDRIRSGRPQRMLVVQIGTRRTSVTLVHDRMAERLPGWAIEAHDAFTFEVDMDVETPKRFN
jgi:DNA-binding NtrC family response regulator